MKRINEIDPPVTLSDRVRACKVIRDNRTCDRTRTKPHTSPTDRESVMFYSVEYRHNGRWLCAGEVREILARAESGMGY